MFSHLCRTLFRTAGTLNSSLLGAPKPSQCCKSFEELEARTMMSMAHTSMFTMGLVHTDQANAVDVAAPAPQAPVSDPRAPMSATDLAVSVGTLKQGFDRNNNPTLTLPVTVVNMGTAALNGGASIDYYLSLDQTLDAGDFRFTSTALPAVRGARSVTKVTLNTIKPGLLAPKVGSAVPVGDYFVIAKLVTKKTGADVNPDNDQAATTTKVTIDYKFGQVGNRSNVPLTVSMPDGSTVNFNMRGAGTGQVLNVDNQIVVVIDGSTKQTSLIITPSKGKTPTFSALTVNGALKVLTADHVTIDGDLSIAGQVGQVTLGNLFHSQFTMGFGFGSDVAIQIGQVADSSITSQNPIRSLSVDRWRDSDTVIDTVSAPYMGNLNSRGDFEAGLTLASNNKGFAMAKVAIGGHITGLWLVNGNMSALNVGSIGAAFNGTIRGDIEGVNVRGNAGGTMGFAGIKRLVVGGNVTGANYLAGADLGGNGALDGSDSGDDEFHAGRIGIIDIRGQMVNSFIGSGVSTTDDILGNSDDQLQSGSFIESISVRKGISHSAFAAAHLPVKATISFKSIKTAGNPAFITVEGS